MTQRIDGRQHIQRATQDMTPEDIKYYGARALYLAVQRSKPYLTSRDKRRLKDAGSVLPDTWLKV